MSQTDQGHKGQLPSACPFLPSYSHFPISPPLHFSHILLHPLPHSPSHAPYLAAPTQDHLPGPPIPTFMFLKPQTWNLHAPVSLELG